MNNILKIVLTNIIEIFSKDKSKYEEFLDLFDSIEEYKRFKKEWNGEDYIFKKDNKELIIIKC